MKILKNLGIFFVMCLALVGSVNAWGFDIPFTEKRITFFETWHFIDFEEQVEEVKKTVSKKVVKVDGEGPAKIDVSSYVSSYPELAKEYEGEVFRVETDQRVIQGYLEGNYLIPDDSREADYVIVVSSESELLRVLKEYSEGGDVSLFDIEEYIDLPFGIKYDLAKYFISK